MRKTMWFYLLLVTLSALGACHDDDDDNDNDDNQPVDDDAGDDDTLDDDEIDDDTTDDDTLDDDLTDDDAGDDDTADDDTADDDTTPVDPYEGLAPVGKYVDQLLAISSHISSSVNPSTTRDFEIEKLDDAGVGLLRTDFSWGAIEPTDNNWSFDGYDTMVGLLAAAGIKVDALLDYGVGWAMPGGSHDEIDPEVWADFNGTVAAHYADAIDMYEIWNEENTERFWQPAPNPAHYGELLKAGYTAIHANDDTAEVLFGGLSPFDIFIFGEHWIWNFLMRVHEEHPDICNYMDAMAIHPYTFLQQTSPELPVDFGLWAYGNLEEMIDHARVLLDEIGCPDKPLYLTEIGWPHYLIGQARQGAYLARGLLIAAAKQVDAYFWYTFWDNEIHSMPPTEDTFGLFTWPGGEIKPKPAYAALLAAHALLGESRFAGDLSAAMAWEQDLHALAFVADDGRWTIGLWSSRASGGSVAMSVPLHSACDGAWELYDQEGALLDSGVAATGEVEADLSGNVVYLRFAVD